MGCGHVPCAAASSTPAMAAPHLQALSQLRLHVFTDQHLLHAPLHMLTHQARHLLLHQLRLQCSLAPVTRSSWEIQDKQMTTKQEMTTKHEGKKHRPWELMEDLASRLMHHHGSVQY